jgi:hypothetical protein
VIELLADTYHPDAWDAVEEGCEALLAACERELHDLRTLHVRAFETYKALTGREARGNKIVVGLHLVFVFGRQTAARERNGS